MERKLSSTLSGAIRPILGGSVALGLWLICSNWDRQASLNSVSWGTFVMPLPSAAPSSRASLADVDGSVASLFERTPDAAGGEFLHGQTRIDLPKSRRSLMVHERAHVLPSGRLAQVEVSLVYSSDERASPADNDDVIAETFDAIAGSVSVERGDGRREAHAVSNLLPWIYLPVRLPSGALASTPVAVAVARRAARAADSVLRLAALDSEVSVTTDQFDVRSADSEWLLLGDDLATFSDPEHGDLLSLHLAGLSVELRPSAVSTPGPAPLIERRAPWKICGTPRCDVRQISPML